MGGILDSIFGGKKESQGTSGGSQTTWDSKYGTSGTSSDAETLAQVLDSILTGGQITKGSAFVRQYGERFMNSLPTIIDRYSKQNAIDDSKEGVQAAITNIINSELGNVLRTESASGTRGSTSTRNALDSIAARAAVAGAEFRQGVIGQYAGIQAQGAQLMTALTELGLDADVSTSESKQGTTSSKESTTANETTEVKENSQTDSKFAGYEKGTERGRDSLFDNILKLVPGDK